MSPKVKEDATARINRINGQVGGIKKMIDEDRYCVDILNQIAAVRSALDQLGVNLLTGHLESCVRRFTPRDRKSTRLNSSHEWISYAVFCLKKKKKNTEYIYN